MSSSPLPFHALNHTQPLPSPGATDLSLTTSASTDVWRKPPSTDVFNAPVTYKALPISAFLSARATISGDWKTLYDQGGLILVIPPTDPTSQRLWIKMGVEFYQQKPFMSVVVGDGWADWSLSSIPSGRVTVEMERGREGSGAGVGTGPVLFVYVVDELTGERVPVREVTGVFHDLDESRECWVGVCAAKPTEDAPDVGRGGELKVRFEGFEVKTK